MFTNRRFTRATAVAVTVCALILAAPQSAMAKVDNLWSIWASEVTDRSKVEIPFVILTSLPAMIVSTPFWLGVWSVDKYKNRDRRDESEDVEVETGSDAAEAETDVMEDEAEATGADTVEATGDAAESDANAPEAAGADSEAGDAGAPSDEAGTEAKADE